MDLGGWDCSVHSKGNFLYFAATTNLIMDNSTKMIEDGIVDSPPNCNAHPVTVSFPSPLKAKQRLWHIF
jgi:hypothetical protein